jgi:HEPN domain-containing protein
MSWYIMKLWVLRNLLMMHRAEEWLRQADYDIDTAEYMFNGGRYFYSVFMIHLAIEKALKGIYMRKIKKTPPKTHNLIFLINQAELKVPESLRKFLIKLNEASIITRYPEDLEQLKRDFEKEMVGNILTRGMEVLSWIKAQY